MFLTFLVFTYYGIMVVAATPGLSLASIISSFFFSFWNLFSGFLIPLPVSRDPPAGWWRKSSNSRAVPQDCGSLLCRPSPSIIRSEFGRLSALNIRWLS